jgi:hypothetical protein
MNLEDRRANSERALTEAIDYAQNHAGEAVRFIITSSFEETSIRRTNDTLPKNLSFVPLKDFVEVFKRNRRDKYFVDPEAQRMMDGKTQDALAAAMMG